MSQRDRPCPAPSAAVRSAETEAAVRAVLRTTRGETLVARRLADGDGPALRRFDAGLSENTRRLFMPHRYDGPTLASCIARSTCDDDRAYVLLAGTAIAGYFFLWHFRDRVPVLGIGLADAYQGQGLGEPIMRLLIEDARAARRDGVELTTMADNERAFRLYTKVGFQYLADVDNWTGDGRLVRERHLFLPLVQGAKPAPREHKPPA
jgi:ribosomal protein S18 acetylase RimI-like enzyme